MSLFIEASVTHQRPGGIWIVSALSKVSKAPRWVDILSTYLLPLSSGSKHLHGLVTPDETYLSSDDRASYASSEISDE